MFSVIWLVPTVVNALNFNVNISIFFMDFLHFERLVKMEGILKMYAKCKEKTKIFYMYHQKKQLKFNFHKMSRFSWRKLSLLLHLL